MHDVYEYKVLDVRDKGGRVNIDTLTDLLNQYGRDGWHLVSAYTNEIGKNALALSGIGINSTADQNILILERKISNSNNNASSSSVAKVEDPKERKRESFSWLQDDKNKETVKEYIEAQLEKTDMSDIYKFQELYFGTTSLAYLKDIVPDVTGFNNIEEYKSALKKCLN